MPIPWELFLIFIFLSLKAEFLPPAVSTIGRSWLPVAMLLVLPFLAWCTGWIAGRIERAIETSHRFARFATALPDNRIFAMVIGLSYMAWLVFGMHWHDFCQELFSGNDMTAIVATLPFIALSTFAWQGVLNGRNAPTAYRHWLSIWLRMSVGFSLLIMLSSQITVLLDIIPDNWKTLGEAAAVLIMLSMILIMPRIMVIIIGAYRIPDGHIRTMVETQLKRWNVRVSEMYVWPTGNWRIPNAAVIGFTPGSRVLLFTDTLLKEFPDEELIAVLAHEVGHFRHRHLPWLIVIVSLFMLASNQLLLAVAGADRMMSHVLFGFGFTNASTDTGGISPSWPAFAFVTTGAVAWSLFLWRGVIGFFSRKFERQADLSAIELTGSGIYLAWALLRISHIIGVSPTRPDWRHGSLSDRIQLLQTAGTAHVERHRREVRRWRIAAVAGLTIIWLIALAFS